MVSAWGEGYNNNNNNNYNNNSSVLVARGVGESQNPAILPRALRDGRKGDPLHECCGENNTLPNEVSALGLLISSWGEGYNNNNNNNNHRSVRLARGGGQSQNPAILPRALRDGRKGDPLHECCGKNNTPSKMRSRRYDL